MSIKKYANMALFVLVYGAFVYILWPFAQVFIFALMVAFALNPLLEKLKRIKKVKLSDVQSISILLAGLFGVLVLPLTIIIIKVASLISKMSTDQIADLSIVQKVQQLSTTVFAAVNSFAQDFGFDLSTQFDIKTHASQLGQASLGFTTALLTNLPQAFLQFMIFIALVYYFLLYQSRLRISLIKANILSETQISHLAGVFEKICHMVLVSTVIIAFLQATIVALGSWIVGYDGVMIIFILAFFLSFIPVLGSSPITISLIGYALINANFGHAIILTMAALAAATIDNVIKSYVFSSSEDSVSPLIALLAIIGSLSMLGPIGLFLGPVIAELAVQVGKIVEQE